MVGHFNTNFFNLRKMLLSYLHMCTMLTIVNFDIFDEIIKLSHDNVIVAA